MDIEQEQWMHDKVQEVMLAAREYISEYYDEIGTAKSILIATYVNAYFTLMTRRE